MDDRARDEAITGMLDGIRLMLRHQPAGWSQWPPSGFAGVSGAPLPTMNGVIASSPAMDPATAAALLDRTRESGVPYSLVFPDRGAADALAAVGSAHGLVRVDDVPLFRLDELAPLEPADGVQVRELGPDEVGHHTALASEVFGIAPAVFEFLVRPGYVAEPGVRFYLASQGGEPVGTGLGVTHAGATAVYNIVTLDAARGRGVGAAVTHRIVADGLAAGGRFALLQASPLAVPLYERLGFRRVDTWQVWVSG